MTLHVFTARISVQDPDRLDITRSGNDPVGGLFAPSERLLWPAKRAMKAADDLERRAGELLFVQGPSAPRRAELFAEAERVRSDTWSSYEPAYRVEMLESYRVHRKAWEALLARPRVVLCCFCVLKPGEPQRCHRRLLASYLAKLGAEDRGEIGGSPQGPTPPETPRDGTTFQPKPSTPDREDST